MLKKNENKSILKVSQNYFHYVGLVIVSLLVFQGYRSTKYSETTLKESVREQEKLRNVLWVNLLTQRATVLSLTPLIDGDQSSYRKAGGIAASIPSFLGDDQGPEYASHPLFRERMKGVLEGFQNLEINLQAAHGSREPLQKLLKEVEQLGIALNSEETEKWAQLISKNESLLEDIHKSHQFANLGYILFILYLFFLGWVSTRKRQAELLLKQSERKGRMLSEASLEGLVVLVNGKINEVNPAFEELFDLSSEEVVGRPIDIFLGTQQIDLLDSFEAIGKKRDGKEIPLEISVKNGIFEDTPIRILAMKDLSERKKSEDFRLQKEAAEQANLAKSVFLANMSHELRTPMHGILSFARFGQQKIETADKPKLKSYFDEIYDSGERLMGLLNDLLDLSKLEAGKVDYSMEIRDFTETVSCVISEMKAFAEEKQLTLSLSSMPEKEVMAFYDEVRMMQVLRNLISNAIKFSEGGSEVKVQIVGSADAVRSVVENRGVGIPPAELETVFDKFVQSSKTKTGAGGTGLGLAICKEIVIQHGGKIWAESQEGGVTRFTVEFPKEQRMRVHSV